MNERDIFLAALEITDPIARSHFLDDVCGSNDALRASVKALFASHEGVGDFLKQPLVNDAGSVSSGNAAIEKPFAAMEWTVHSSREQQALNAEDDETREDGEVPLGFLSPSTKQDSLGRLGHYEIVEVLGKGAFGTVLRAFDEKLHRMVAIKVMSAELASGSPARKRFLREARSAAAIRHDNVVAIYAVEEEPIPYLVMEYIPGKTLQQFLKAHGPLDVADTLRLSQQMANGLAAAHSQGLIHRDIKPANILLEVGIQWKVKISDFGLARAADDASLTQSGTIAGTPMYMSPEQAHSTHIDQRSDLFSLGSVLYEMVSGRPPFRASSTLAVLKRVTEDTPRPIPEIIPEVPDWLCTIIAKLHSKQPADRYQTANEIAELLARCQSELQLNGKVTCVAIAERTARPESSKGVELQPGTPFPKQQGVPPDPAERSALWTPLKSSTFSDRPESLLKSVRSLWVFTVTFVSFLIINAGLVWWGRELTGMPIKWLHGVIAGGTGLVALTCWIAEFVLMRRRATAAAQTFAGFATSACLLAAGNGVMTWMRTETTVTKSATSPMESPKVVSSDTQSTGWHGWSADAPPPAIAPFNAEHAQQHQQAWAKYLGIPVTFNDKHGTKYVLIPPGEFQMGYSADEIDTLIRELKQAGASEYDQFSASTSGPQHKVRITRPCYMSAHEVTVAEYRRFIDETHYMTTAEQLGGVRKKWSEYLAPENQDLHPVLGVSWTDAEMFCALRSKQDGVTYRLPIEAEWEYACRAGTTTHWSFGDNPAQIGEHAVASANGTATQPVGSRKPNPFGLFDMYGNVEEWCLDWHIQDYFAKSPVDDPVNLATPTDSNSGRVARGGGTISLPWQLHSSIRRWDYPSTPVNLKGFRVVIGGDLKKAVENIAGSGWHGWPSDAPPPAIAPFNAEQAQQHQEAWAKYLNVPVEYTNSIGMKFRLIPPGEFMMGSSPEEIEESLGSAGDDKLWQETINSEGPRHKVILTKATYGGVHEVTQGQFEHVMGRNPSRFGPMGASKEIIADLDTSSFPVEKVSWDEATRFCMKLGQMQGLSDDNAYRLLTDAEWEFSCRAGTTTEYWTGENHQERLQAAWLYENSGERTHAVGELKRNPFGLYDVHGNVWEWVQDGWDPTFYKQLQGHLAVDPIKPSIAGAPHVTRGGCWSSSITSSRSTSRCPETAAYSGTLIGFRVELPVDAVRTSLKLTGPAIPKSPTTDRASTKPAAEMASP